jgi:hypothetical protein
MKTGPTQTTEYPKYVKPNQPLRIHGMSKKTETAYIEMHLVSPNDDNKAYIEYCITDRNNKPGRWHSCHAMTSENYESTLFKTTFVFTPPNGDVNDITLQTLASGEVQITGKDANNNGNTLTWTSHNNDCPDDDTTWKP